MNTAIVGDRWSINRDLWLVNVMKCKFFVTNGMKKVVGLTKK